MNWGLSIKDAKKSQPSETSGGQGRDSSRRLWREVAFFLTAFLAIFGGAILALDLIAVVLS